MTRAALFVLLTCAAGRAWAVDPWEQGLGGSDDFSTTPNLAVHGRPQTHDLQSEPGEPNFEDIDFIRVPTRAGQSYEVRVYSASVGVITSPGCAPSVCAALGRYEPSGVFAQAAAAVEGETLAAALRWTAATDGFQLVRMHGAIGTPGLATDQYTIEMTNTTLFAPRFNNSGTQITILILQNTTTAAVASTVTFFGPDGTAFAISALSIPAHGAAVLNTSTVPGLAGSSGSIQVAQNGGYAALTGKAVALEPATGFTFDTPLLPLPR